jgi:hypothetical protein
VNARRRLQREIIRQRRQYWWPVVSTRIVTPNGTRVRVTLMPMSCALHAMHADYKMSGAAIYGPWPPTPELLRELGRWA